MRNDIGSIMPRETIRVLIKKKKKIPGSKEMKYNLQQNYLLKVHSKIKNRAIQSTPNKVLQKTLNFGTKFSPTIMW